MFNSVAAATLWQRRKALFFWSAGVFIYVLMISLMYPSIEGVEGFAALAEEMPDALQALLGEIDDITTPQGFLGAELYSLMLPVLLSILAIGAGASLISKEEDSATLELLLASPISRSQILLHKALALAVNVVGVALMAWTAIALATLMIDFDVNLANTAAATLSAALLGLGFGAFALAVTAAGGRRGLAIGLGAALFVLSYFANTLAVLVPEIESLQYASLLYYYDGQGMLENGLEAGNIVILVAFAAVVYLLGALRWRGRDIGV